MPERESDAVAAAQTPVEQIPVINILPNPDNPRDIDTESEAFREFAEGIGATGVRIPVAVQPDRSETSEGGYVLIYGERRWRASMAAGRETIPALVYEDLTPEEAFELCFAENFDHEDLTPLEEGRAVEILTRKFHGDVKAVAAKLGKSSRWVHQMAKLKDLTDGWKEDLHKPEIAEHVHAGHLAVIARLPAETQERVRKRCLLDLQLGHLSVAELEQCIEADELRKLSAAPFDPDDMTLVKNVMACAGCPKRASAQGMLFLDDEDDAERRKNDQCLDADCWQKKCDAWLMRQWKEAQRTHKDLAPCVNHGNISYWEQDKYGKLSKHKLVQLKGDSWENRIVCGQRAKEGDAGARPGLIVSGKGLGELIWWTPRRDERAKGSSGSTSAASGPKPLKERRAVLDAKRRSHVAKALEERVEKCPFDSTEMWGDGTKPELNRALNMIRVAVAFGTDHKRSAYGKDYSHATGCHTDPWKLLQGESRKLCVADLWGQVRPVLAARLRCTLPITQTPPELDVEIERIAALCGIDLAPLRTAAAEAYPEPKTWAQLNEDGTRRLRQGSDAAGKPPAKKAPRKTALKTPRAKTPKSTTKGTKTTASKKKGTAKAAESAENKPEWNEHGVCARGANRTKIPMKDGSASIRTVLAPDGKWRVGVDYDIPRQAGGGWAPSLTGTSFDAEDAAIMEALDYLEDYFDKPHSTDNLTKQKFASCKRAVIAFREKRFPSPEAKTPAKRARKAKPKSDFAKAAARQLEGDE